MKMIRNKLILAFAFLALAFCTVDAQKISRKCLGSSSTARIEILANGNIEIVPCPNKTVTVNGGLSGGGGGGNGQGLSGYTVANTSTDRTLDPNNVGFTLAELANITGTVITDLQTTGILNATTPSLFELGDETTTLTTGVKKTVRMPTAFLLVRLRASVTTASTSGAIVIDIKQNGTSILGSNKLSIDATEFTSSTAATAVSISTANLTDDAEITFTVTSSGANAAGLKVWMVGRYTAP